MKIQAVAVPIHLHHHLQVQHLHNRQEEQVSPAAIQSLRRHLQPHLQGNDPIDPWPPLGQVQKVSTKALASFELEELQHIGHAADA